MADDAAPSASPTAKPGTRSSGAAASPTADTLAKRMLRSHWSSLSTAERDVIEAVLARIAERPAVSHDEYVDIHESRTFGERVADRIAAFGGSWTFILIFIAFLILWTVVNTKILRGQAFDAYPFIFLNLLLSMVAALQAPLIMMSQNRAALRDRMEAKNDYRVNLKAELEIRELHGKLDALREKQWEALVELQHDQIRLLQQLCGVGAEEKPA